MPTDNPKISLYVPQAIYDRFIEYKDKLGLSMSQAGTVLLAEYFGIEETIKEITEGTTVGGVTISRVEAIEQELKELKEQVNKIVNQQEIKIVNHELITDELLSKDQTITGNIQNKLLKLISPSNEYRLEKEILAKRLDIGNPSTVINASNSKTKPFDIWSKERDPNRISWKKLKINRSVLFEPISDTPIELLSKLKEWINKNID